MVLLYTYTDFIYSVLLGLYKCQSKEITVGESICMALIQAGEPAIPHITVSRYCFCM